MFQKFLTVISALLNAFIANHDIEAAKNGLSECRNAIRNLNKRLKNVKSVGEKQKLQTILAKVKSCRAQFKVKKIGSVSRKEKPSDRIKWDDLKSAFASRIRTGLITNLKHLDGNTFLDDSKKLFERRLSNVCNGTIIF